MIGLDRIVGQARAVEILRGAVVSGKIHHGYLFEGPDGIGKLTTARALAAALNCDARDPAGCGRCASCLKLEAGNHPDFLFFDMTPKGLTERVRDLIGQLGFRPHEGRARVVVFDPADGLAAGRAEAANVLLKTLEEPPSQTHFVLVTAEPKRLPVTVRSRCQRIRFQPLEDSAVEKFLVEREGVTAGAAREASARAGGSLGRALAEVTAGDGDESGPKRLREQVERIIAAARKNDPRAIFDAASEVGGDREQAEAACAQLWTVLRDALLGREGLGRGRVSPARADFAAQLVGDRSAAAILRSLRAASEAVESLRGNVAPSLALEHLMLQMAPRARESGPGR